ncbi:MAG TPA: AMP-binding protein, partial [Burkholderiales bacterium]|nr:AMP-binding protein [Burkholderiales bacterium]
MRAGRVFADRIAVIDGDQRYTYAEFLDRSLRLAGALHTRALSDGARVAVLAPNTHVLLEAHYGVPLAGAVLVALNPRLTAADLSAIVAHAGATMLIYDHEHQATARVIASACEGLTLIRAGDEYEAMLAHAQPYYVT